MNKVKTLFLIAIMSLIWGSSVAQNTDYNWTWIAGTNTGRTSVFGTQGIHDSNNIPGGGKTDMYTTDLNGNFWLYGGGNGSSVLWKNDGTGWAWIAGTSTDITGSGFYPDPEYGNQGVADPANRPSVRSGGTIATDSQGNVWLFGGYGEDGHGNLNMRLNDLWKFDGTNWTWISGSDQGNQTANYGSKGEADAANMPGSRSDHVMWIDSQDNIWVFGGDGWASTTPNGGSANRLNDLWKFDGTNWTWVAGNNGYFQQGIFGTKGIGDPNNTPGARYDAMGWINNNDELYLFGGIAHGQISATGTTSSLSPINDLWKFDGTNWIWIGGADTLRSLGVYGSKGTVSPDNIPSARAGASFTKFSNGDIVVHTGYGIDPTTGLYYKDLSDTWIFDGSDWKWQSGPNTSNESPVFGSKGTASQTNTPGARHSAALWSKDDNLYFFGGRGNHGSSYDSFGVNDYWVGESVAPSIEVSISQIFPEATPTGSEAYIYGSGFSTTTSDQTVEIGGVAAIITSAIESRLTIEVPELTPGLHTVSVTKDGVTDQLINAFQWLIPSAPSFGSEDFLFAMNDIININSGDFNNNGDIDLVMNSGALNDVDIRYNNQNFQFTSLTNIHSTFENHDAHPVDIDDDGDLDVIASLITQNTPTNTTDDRVAWFRNNGPESNPTYTELTISTSVNGGRDIFAADLDGDGDKDVLSTSLVSGVITWHRNNEGVFTESFDVTNNAPGVSGVHAADLNNDGLMDVLSAANQTVSWYPNEGQGVFTQKYDIISGESNVGEVKAVDFDNDGHLDVLTNGLNALLWFRNDGTGDFSDRRTIDASINEPIDFLPADLDGDGDQDVIAVSENNGSPKWYQNLGDGRFSKAKNLPASINRAFGIDAADYDNDGDIDIIVAQRFATDNPGAYLYENTSVVNEPYAYFPFDGDILDASSNAFALNTVGDPTLDRDPGGAIDSAYYFDGSDDYFETQVSEPFEFQSFTFSMWVNAYSLPPQGKASVFLAKQPANVQTGFYSYLFPDGGIFTSIFDNNGANTRRTSYTVNIGEWTHFAVTYNGSVLQTYVNGVPEAAQQFDADIIYDNSPLTIGGYNHPTNSFDGKMDEVRIYDVALAPEELTSIYASEKPDEFDNTSDWTSIISTNADGKNSSAEFGTTPTSTDGFDASLDIPLPPIPNGDYLQLYFEHSEFGGSLGDKYRSDFKAYSDYETSNSNWQLSLYSSFATSDTLLVSRPNGFTAPIKVIDEDGVEHIGLAGDLELLYSIQAGETKLFDIVVGDISPPTIELGAVMNGPQIWDKTFARSLTWNVEDPSGITNITTEVSYDGGQSWQLIYSGLDENFEFTPDANIVLNQATLFRVSATDGASQEFTNSTTVAGDHEITIVAPSQSLDYGMGWQMVGSPFADTIEPSSVLSEAIRYRWNSASFEYLLTDSYPNKEGIWLGGYSNGSDQLDGEVGETDATLTVYSGWNMVTVPLFRNVQVDSISVFDGTSTGTYSDAVSNFDITVPQGHNGSGYEIAESLEVFSSYWIGVTTDSLVLTMPIHRFNPALKQSQITEDDELLLTIVDGEFEQQLLVRVGGEPSQPAPPPAPNSYRIGLEGESSILGNTYSQYSLSSSEQEGTEIPFVIDGPERLITINWHKTGFESVPISINALENHALESESGSIEITTTELNSAVLAFGEMAVNTEENLGVPVALKLKQNYPNPFNPSTTIGFDLPEKARVRIDVFNVTGQKVATIVNNTLHAGSHALQFDASELSSGTYIYRIQAGNYTETRKMILIK